MELVMVNEIVISEMRKSDGYINGTRMCQAVNKKLHDYLRSKATEEFLGELSSETGIPVSELVKKDQTGSSHERGTWVHPQVAPDLAAWCSPGFRVSVSTLVLRYMTGQVTTEESRNMAAMMGFAPPPLPPPDVRVSSLVSSLQALGIEMNNPRYSQALRDVTLNILGVDKPAITNGEEERWSGVVEIAEQMGFREAVKLDVRTRLGRYISKNHKWDDEDCDEDLHRRREKRLCNGTDREIWVYKDTPTLRELIREFFKTDTPDTPSTSTSPKPIYNMFQRHNK